jgi:DNA repair exonuclease SbcCD ATPase subunit
LNELDNNLREQENLLADKNAKLAQAITEKTALESENQQLLTNYQQAQSQKVVYENYLQMALKVNNLNNLPINNSGQGLQELITYYNNHNPRTRLISLKTQVKNVIAQYRDDQEINNNDLNTQLITDYSITQTNWESYIANATNETELASRKLNILNTLAKLIIVKHSQQNQVDSLQSQILSLNSTITTQQDQIDNHVCPACSHSDYDNLKNQLKTLTQEKEQIQQTLNHTKKIHQQELKAVENQVSEQTQQKIIQQLNTTFKLNLDKNEKDLNKAIEKIQKLVDKPPLIVEDKKKILNLEQGLAQNQQTIVRLEKELVTKSAKPLEIEKNTNLKTLTKIEEVLNTSLAEFKEQTKNVNNCQELDNLRDK